MVSRWLAEGDLLDQREVASREDERHDMESGELKRSALIEKMSSRISLKSFGLVMPNSGRNAPD
jgi:hypothetical protein